MRIRKPFLKVLSIFKTKQELPFLYCVEFSNSLNGPLILTHSSMLKISDTLNVRIQLVDKSAPNKPMEKFYTQNKLPNFVVLPDLESVDLQIGTSDVKGVIISPDKSYE